MIWIADWDAGNVRWGEPVLWPRSNNEPALAAAELVQSLPERDRSIADNFFGGGGGPVVWFYCRKDDQVAVAYLRQLVGHHSPIFVCFTARGEHKVEDLSPAHPLLARFLALKSYDWDTPEYRALCGDLGLDPDYRRPELLPEYAEMGRHLMQWIGGRLGLADVREDDQWCQRLNLASAMVTALTPEGNDNPSAVRDALNRLKEVPRGAVPYQKEFLQAFASFQAPEPERRTWRPAPRPDLLTRVAALLRRPYTPR